MHLRTQEQVHTHTSTQKQTISLPTVICAVYNLPVCLLVLIERQQGRSFIFVPTVPRSSAERVLKLCIIKSLLALKCKRSLSTE